MDRSEVTAEWIAEQLHLHRLPQKELARVLGIAPSGVTRLLAGTRKVRPEEVDVVREFFARAAGDHLAATPEHRPAAPLRRWEYVDARPLKLEDMLPVHTLALSGDGSHRIGDIVEYRKVPTELRGVRAAYACYISDDSHSPLLLRGDVFYVHPGRPVVEGARSLAKLDDGSVLIGRYSGTSGKPRLLIGNTHKFLPAETKMAMIVLIQTH